MASDMTLSLTGETAERLARLSSETNRDRAELAIEALDTFLARELSVRAGIGRGLDDMRHGHVVPHDEAMAEIDAILAAAGGSGM